MWTVVARYESLHVHRHARTLGLNEMKVCHSTASRLEAQDTFRGTRAICGQLLIVVAVATLFSGCSSTSITEYTTDTSGHLRRVGVVTPIEVFQHKVAREARFEAAGLRPPGGSRTWREY